MLTHETLNFAKINIRLVRAQRPERRVYPARSRGLEATPSYQGPVHGQYTAVIVDVEAKIRRHITRE